MRSIICPKPVGLENILAAKPEHRLDPAGNDAYPSAQDMPRALERQRLQALLACSPAVLASWIMDLNERADDLEAELADVRANGLWVNEG
jgi:hypothetical protein